MAIEKYPFCVAPYASMPKPPPASAPIPSIATLLIFDATAAPEASRWRFHASQTVEPLDDGRVRVRFRARGMRELAWHLFTWGASVKIEAPQRLRGLLKAELEASLAAHG